MLCVRVCVCAHFSMCVCVCLQAATELHATPLCCVVIHLSAAWCLTLHHLLPAVTQARAHIEARASPAPSHAALLAAGGDAGGGLRPPAADATGQFSWRGAERAAGECASPHTPATSAGGWWLWRRARRGDACCYQHTVPHAATNTQCHIPSFSFPLLPKYSSPLACCSCCWCQVLTLTCGCALLLPPALPCPPPGLYMPVHAQQGLWVPALAAAQGDTSPQQQHQQHQQPGVPQCSSAPRHTRAR